MKAILAGIAAVGTLFGAIQPSKSTTVVSGLIREAVRGKPIAGVLVEVGGTTTTSDNEGRFAMVVSNTSSSLIVRREGYLEFQYPILKLRGDSLTAEIDLRPNPLTSELYTSRNGRLPFLCILDDGHRLRVLHGGYSRRDLPEYETRIIKHNPWSPYFGEAADRSGVLLAIRSTHP
jgi:hypothetical protein